MDFSFREFVGGEREVGKIWLYYDFSYNTLMTPATLHIPKTDTTLELTPELADMIASAIEDYRETKSDETLRANISKNSSIASHTDRIRSLHAIWKL